MVPDIEVPNAAGSFPDRRHVLRWASGGVAAAGARAAAAVARPRATIVNVHAGQAEQKKVVDFYGAEVLPKLCQRG